MPELTETGMRYRIQIKGFPTLWLTQEQFDALDKAMTMHIDNGFRDGATRTDLIEIVECGIVGNRP